MSHSSPTGHADTTHAHDHHEEGHDHHDVQSHIKTYIGVFVALLVGTVLTVGMYYVHFESMALTIAIALFIASIKAFLVAGFFMHLMSEKKAIYSMLLVTAVFFVALGGLTLWASHDWPSGSQPKTHYVP